MIADGQALLDRDVGTELVQGEHLEPPVAGHAGLVRALGQVGQRGGIGARGVMGAAAQDQRAGGHLGISGPFGRLQRLGGQRGGVAGRKPAHGVLAGPQPGPARAQPVARRRGVPGQRFRLAGQQVGRPAVMREPGRFRRAGVQHVADEVVGELVVAAADHEEPVSERRLAQLERGRRNQVEHDAEGQRVDRGSEHRGRPEQRLHRRPGAADPGLDGGPQRFGHALLAARQGAQHLDHEQGVTAGPLQDALGQLALPGGARELRHRVRAERPHLDPAGHRGERRADLRVVLRPDRGHHQQPGPGRLTAEEVHELHRRLPGILQVVH